VEEGAVILVGRLMQPSRKREWGDSGKVDLILGSVRATEGGTVEG